MSVPIDASTERDRDLCDLMRLHAADQFADRDQRSEFANRCADLIISVIQRRLADAIQLCAPGAPALAPTSRLTMRGLVEDLLCWLVELGVDLRTDSAAVEEAIAIIKQRAATITPRPKRMSRKGQSLAKKDKPPCFKDV